MSAYQGSRYLELRRRMREKDQRGSDMARRLQVAGSTFSRKMTGHVPFTADEMYLIMDVLDIDNQEMHKFFPRRGISPACSAK